MNGGHHLHPFPIATQIVLPAVRAVGSEGLKSLETQNWPLDQGLKADSDTNIKGTLEQVT